MCLHTLVGSKSTMAAQARHLADIGTRSNLSIRILPFAAGIPWDGTPVLPYIILDFPESERQNGTEPPVVYTENTIGTMFFEQEEDVLRYREIHACRSPPDTSASATPRTPTAPHSSSLPTSGQPSHP